MRTLFGMVAAAYLGLLLPAHAQQKKEAAYLDLGGRIECSVRAQEGQVQLDGNIELSKQTGSVCAGICEPIIGQAKIVFQTSVPPGVATAIPAPAKYQVQVTVTPLDSLALNGAQRARQRVEGVVPQ